MGVDKVQSRCGPPVPEQPRLDVVLGQRLLEQRIVVEIDLADRKVVGGPPVRVYQCPFVARQHVCHHCLRDLLSLSRASGVGVGWSIVNRRTVLRNAREYAAVRYQAVLLSSAYFGERIVALRGLLQ